MERNIFNTKFGFHWDTNNLYALIIYAKRSRHYFDGNMKRKIMQIIILNMYGIATIAFRRNFKYLLVLENNCNYHNESENIFSFICSLNVYMPCRAHVRAISLQISNNTSTYKNASRRMIWSAVFNSFVNEFHFGLFVPVLD